MLGRSPDDLTIVRPVRDGVISHFEITTEMLRHLLRRVQERRFLLWPRMIIAVPAGLNDVERKAVRECATRAGAGEVLLIEEAVAAAIGAGFDVTAPDATMVVDIGGGTTEVAVISCLGVLYSRSTRLGGDMIDETIIQYIRRNHNLLIGQLTAENVKIGLAGLAAEGNSRTMAIKGRDLLADAPKTLEIKSEEIQDALDTPIRAIVDRVRIALEGIPPETSADIAEKGIMLVGGGSLLAHLELRLRQGTGLPVRRVPDPLSVIAIGAGRCLEDAALREALTLKA
jgi:rod shape-determining protein MreB